MREDHEERILRNPAFGACALWHVARYFADTSDGRSPSLAHLILAYAMIQHGGTVDKIANMQFDSGLMKAVVEEPDLVAGLQGRVEQGLAGCLMALQVGVASELLVKEWGDGLPSFRAIGANLPSAIRQPGPTFATAKRLGIWFASDDLGTLQSRLGVRL